MGPVGSRSDPDALAATDPAPAPVVPGPGPVLSRGTGIGRYLLLDQLGAGGMGVVYAAYDPELDRKVAIKLLRAGRGDDGESRGRLQREAQAMAQLSHPNVIAVYDVGTLGEQVFVAMEFVEGGTLRQWQQQAPRGWREIVDRYLLAGRGLGAAHAAGLVHRDFKPDNVMVGKDGRVRVMDFGLARSVAGAGERPGRPPPSAELEALLSGSNPGLALPLTATGALLGSPLYMAPEQYLGGTIDPRTDEFSFCVALYEALYGQPPFAAPSAVGLMRNVTKGRIQPPPREARVPPWLRRILLRGLSVAPEARYPSMTELLAALGQDPYRALRRRLTVAGAVAGLLALAVGYRALHRGPVKLCQGSRDRLAGVWDPEQKQRVRQAFLGVSAGKAYAQDAWTGVEHVLDRYTDGWVTAHGQTCEATHVRGEQSAALLDLRMECLNRRLQDVAALAQLFAHPDETVLQKAVTAAHALPALADCSDTASLLAKVKPPSDPATRARVQETYKRLADARARLQAGKYPDGLKLVRVLAGTAREIGYQPLLADVLFVQVRLEIENGEAQAAAQTAHQAGIAGIAGRHYRQVAQTWILLGYVTGNLQEQEGQKWIDLAQATLNGEGGDRETDEVDPIC